MDSNHYQRIKAVFEKVISTHTDSPAGRAAVLDESCGGDEGLRRDVAALLRHADKPVIDIEREAQRLDASVIAQSSLPTPQRIGEYHILHVLGEGGMGVVYLAEQERPRRKVALKVLRPGFATPRMLRRFEFEAEVLGRLHHPGIAQVYEAGVAEVEPLGRVAYFAMEHVQGRSLREYVRGEHLSITQRLSLMIDIARAVEHAHRQGVVHRDLKPGNIVIDESSGQPQPKILDFGIARTLTVQQQTVTLATHTGEVIGTLPYMSPEHVSGDSSHIDARADVYSLGVILFELLTDRLPLDVASTSIPESIRAICEDEPTHLSTLSRVYRGDLDTIVSKSLEKDPDRRYPSAGDLADDLERFLHNEPIAARPASALYQLRKFARRNRVMVGGVAAVIIALTAGVIATAFKAREANAQRIRAESEAQASKQVSSFLHEVLTTLDPFKAGAPEGVSLDGESPSLIGNRTITVREALDQAAPKIESLGQMSGPRVRASLHRTVGLAYKAVGEHALAETHLRTAYQLMSDELGPNDQQTLDAANELVLVLAHLKKLDEAHELVTGALNAARANLPADGETVTDLLAASGIVAYWRGEREEAARLQREHLDLMIELRGPEHRRTLVSMSNLGLTLSDMNQLDEADALLSRCAELRAKSLGENHVETLYARNNLANLRQKQGTMAEAAAIWDDVVERARDVLGPAHPDWQAWVRNLALANALQGDVNHGIVLLEESRGYLAIDGERTHPGVVHHLGMLAMFLTEAGRLDDAQPIIDEVHDLSVQIFGPEHIETIRSYTLYYDLAEKRGDEQAMATWAAKLAGTPFDPNPPPAPQAEDDAASSQ